MTNILNFSVPQSILDAQIEPSVSIDQLERLWDVVVIGAGPAGALSAFLAANKGLRTLLVDKSEFPRSKVCGSCLNHVALSSLEEAGLIGTIESLGAVDLHSLELSINGVKSSVALSCGKSLSRKALDASLVKEAIRKGAAFVPNTVARLVSQQQGLNLLDFAPGEPLIEEIRESDFRTIELRIGNSTVHTQAKIVIVADGIAGHALDQEPGFERTLSEGSRIGAGATVAASDVPPFYKSGHIFMASSQGGYVGVVQLENGDYDVACAFDREFVKTHGDPGNAATAILKRAKMPLIALDKCTWRGTPALTQSITPKATARIFVIGDASGYTEPFTGEGIGWAYSSALQLAPIVSRAVLVPAEQLRDLYKHWEWAHNRLLTKRHSTSSQIASLLRWQYLPEMVSLAVSRSKSIETAVVRTALGPQMSAPPHTH